MLNLRQTSELARPVSTSWDENILKFQFVLHNVQTVTSRTVYSLNQLLADAGGLYAALFWLGSVLNFFL